MANASDCFESGVFEHSPNRVFGALDEIVSALIEDFGADFLTCPDRPIDGAKYSILRFRFDSVVFDQKLRTALLASGLDFSNQDFTPE